MNGQLVHYEAYTPMAYDIQAAQYLYGANPTTEFGATTFTFTPSTPRVQAIYDTGGIDAIDLSNFALRSVVDLTPGASSTFGYTHHIDDNTAIAFGSIVENVFSGSGSDDVFGNDADNEIHAGAGDDLVTGGAGNDTLLGQSDHDTISDGTGNDHVFGGDGHDHLSDAWGNDTLSGGAGTDTLISHLGDNTLSGGSVDDVICTGLGDDESDGGSGDDLLTADYPHRFARGNDTLIGGEGNDKLDGGKGADEFVFFLDQTGNDTIAQFDIDGTLLSAGFEVAQDQIHLITGTGTAQDYSLQDTDKGSVLTWGSPQILIYGVSEDDLGFFDIVMDHTWT
jgi:Ca2+-binding RTX toxin-like protein